MSPQQKRVYYRTLRLLAIFIMLFSIPFVLMGVMGGLPYLTNPRSASAEGTITKVVESQSTNSDGNYMTYCSLSYRFEVNGKSYDNTSSMSSDTYCGLSEGGTIKIKYDPNSPTDNTYGDNSLVSSFFSMFIVSGLATFALGLILFTAVSHKRKFADLDGDGLGDDLKPATEEQMKLIENGFRELGQFYVRPQRSINRAQAREILRWIQDQSMQGKTPHSTNHK